MECGLYNFKLWHVLTYIVTSATKYPSNSNSNNKTHITHTILQNFGSFCSCGFSFFHYIPVVCLVCWPLCCFVFCSFILTLRKISKYFNNRIRLFSFNTISFPYTQIGWMREAIPSTRQMHLLHLGFLYCNPFHISMFYCTVSNIYFASIKFQLNDNGC